MAWKIITRTRKGPVSANTSPSIRFNKIGLSKLSNGVYNALEMKVKASYKLQWLVDTDEGFVGLKFYDSTADEVEGSFKVKNGQVNTKALMTELGLTVGAPCTVELTVLEDDDENREVIDCYFEIDNLKSAITAANAAKKAKQEDNEDEEVEEAPAPKKKVSK